jgi:hypothetical protein
MPVGPCVQVSALTQCRLLVLYRRFGTTYQSHLQGSRSPRRKESRHSSLTSWPLKMGAICCLETSVDSKLYNTPEERRVHAGPCVLPILHTNLQPNGNNIRTNGPSLGTLKQSSAFVYILSSIVHKSIFDIFFVLCCFKASSKVFFPVCQAAVAASVRYT